MKLWLNNNVATGTNVAQAPPPVVKKLSCCKYKSALKLLALTNPNRLKANPNSLLCISASSTVSL
jgi:hypothetical protein